MIKRYSRPKMSGIWSEEAKYRTWLDIEVLACEAWSKVGKVPKEALHSIKQNAAFDIDSILEKEAKTKHDVAAFVSDVQERVGKDGKYIHYGLTSSDVLDTAFSYRLYQSAKLILKEIEPCLEVTKKRALECKEMPMIGRTHGIHAEPMSMGLKWLNWYDVLKRAKSRIEFTAEEIRVGKLSGAVGNYAHTPPEVEKFVCDALGLRVDTLSTQVIARDRYGSYFSSLALLGGAIESIAVELRHLQRTEVGEVREGFTKGQKGSSAMPHKRNPISAENLTGCARLLRGMLLPALENCALWHERDISHSAAERVIAPDANILADYMLGRLHTLLSNLEVFPERMQKNLDMLQGVVFSQKILLGLIEGGCSRDQAYEIVQRNALRALDSQTPLLGILKQDPDVTKVLPEKSLDVLFEPKTYFKHLDYLYKKVLDQ